MERFGFNQKGKPGRQVRRTSQSVDNMVGRQYGKFRDLCFLSDMGGQTRSSGFEKDQNTQWICFKRFGMVAEESRRNSG